MKHSIFDPFELLDGDCLLLVQLAANIKGLTTHSLTHDTFHRPYLNIVSNLAGGREPACRADKRASLAVPPHKLWKAGNEPSLSHHSNTARQMQVQQTSRRAFHVCTKFGRNKISNTDFPKTSASLSTMCFCINRQDAYTALAKKPGCTALIPPQMDPKDRHNMFSMCTEAFLFPGSFTQAEISLRTHTFNSNKNEEQYRFDVHFSPWGLTRPSQ